MGVAAALEAQQMLDAWEEDPPTEEGHLRPETAQRLDQLAHLAVKLSADLKNAWHLGMQERSGWETAAYVRRMQAFEFLARVVADVLTRTQENVAQTQAAHPNWAAPLEMADAQANLPAVREILVSVPELIGHKFREHASRWKRETRSCSSRTKMVEHPAYKEIVRMGQAALPFILKELRTDPHYWFPALQAITGEDPVPEADRGIVPKMTDAWLQWGQVHGC
jgi:hypothetical protein